MRLTKVKIIEGKRYELVEKSSSRDVLYGLAEGYLEDGCSVKIVLGGLYVSKHTPLNWKPSTKSNVGQTSIKIGSKKYKREAVYRIKWNAIEDAKHIRKTGVLARVVAVPIGWGVYYRFRTRHAGKAARGGAGENVRKR